MTFDEAMVLLPLVHCVRLKGTQLSSGMVTSVEIREAHGERWAVVNAVWEEEEIGRRGWHADSLEIAP